MIARAALAVWLALAGAAHAAPLPPIPEGGRLSFAVWREGSRIGTHVMRFRRDGDTLTVESRVDVEVRFAFVTLYRYAGRRREVWRDGTLVAFDSETDDDGKAISVRVRPAADGLLAEGSKGRSAHPPSAVPFTLWNRAIVEGRPLFDAEDGKPLKAAAQPLGASPPPGAQAAAAQRFRLTGDVDHEFWYAERGVLAGLRLTGRDGSIVEYRAE
jgi:hypothetical protein